MCGIVGYIGKQAALPFLLKGLSNLEYRGYDSCGVALVADGRIRVIKTRGEVKRLVEKTRGVGLESSLGIGHTRWATHGKPSRLNAHPHLDCSGKIAVVHNGIVENYEELRRKLVKKRHKFASETDTEVLPHLVEEYLKKKKDLFWAVGEALKEVVGAYGMAVVGADFPEEMVIGRLSSPLILGLGKGENWVASDQPALLSWTKKMAVLKNGQIARVRPGAVEVRTLDGQTDRYQQIFGEGGRREVSRAGYPHFMLKEIFEQPRVIEAGLRGRFDYHRKKNRVKLGGIEECLGRFKKLSFLPMVACGTSYHAALVGKDYFQKLANLPVLVEDATELVGKSFPWRRGQVVIFTSQSGETADVLSVLRGAKKKGIFPLGLVNVAGSTLSRETRAGVYLRAGFEIGVGATKTFMAQMLVFLLWAILAGRRRGVFNYSQNKRLMKEMASLSELISSVLRKKKEIRKLAGEIKGAGKIYLLGRGRGYALALEGALKIKEIAYLPAEAIATGELKHGPLALVDKKTVLLFLIPDDEQFEKNLNSLNEASARGGKILVLTNKRGKFWEKSRAKVFYFKGCHPLLAVFPITAWLQLLAYYLSDWLGRPIDKPRNLAKSVTVE